MPLPTVLFLGANGRDTTRLRLDPESAVLAAHPVFTYEFCTAGSTE